jgi:hypothetical protein
MSNRFPVAPKEALCVQAKVGYTEKRMRKEGNPVPRAAHGMLSGLLIFGR